MHFLLHGSIKNPILDSTQFYPFSLCYGMGIWELRANYLRRLQDAYTDFPLYAKQIELACDFAIRAHKGQVRKYENVPFVSHPMSVSVTVAQRYKDLSMIIAALLHDTAEDCEDVNIQQVYDLFGNDVGFIVDGVSAEPLHFYWKPEIIYNDKIEKLLAGGLEDIRTLLLKLADREHNLATLDGMHAHKQIRMAFETQAIYEPLKRIIGEWCTVLAKCDSVFHKYIEANNLIWPKDIKNHLYNQSFEDFDNDTFNLIYRNTGGITWKVEDKTMFKELIARDNFDQKIEILSIEEDLAWEFKATFRYKLGEILHYSTKLGIENNEFFI